MTAGYTPTEKAVRALAAALQAAAVIPDAVIPAPLRNEDMLSQLVDLGGSDRCKVYLNVLDGDPSDGDEFLGADISPAESYDLARRVEVEWAVAGGDSDAREAAFDRGRKAIWDALKPKIVAGEPVYLGGAVDGLRLVGMVGQGQTNADGLPGVKACLFIFELTYSSPDPF